jgi:hypothetical protein
VNQYKNKPTLGKRFLDRQFYSKSLNVEHTIEQCKWTLVRRTVRVRIPACHNLCTPNLISKVWKSNNHRPLFQTMQSKLQISSGSLQLGKLAAWGHYVTRNGRQLQPRLVCLWSFIRINTARAVTQKGHKIFDFTGNLARKQNSEIERLSANLYHVFISNELFTFFLRLKPMVFLDI